MFSKNELVSLHCDIYNENDKVGRLDIENGVLLRNDVFTDILVLHPFPKSTTAYSILNILRDRVIPIERWENVYANHIGIKEYNPYKILKKNHGIRSDDFIWLKFDEDPKGLKWEDVMFKR